MSSRSVTKRSSDASSSSSARSLHPAYPHRGIDRRPSAASNPNERGVSRMAVAVERYRFTVDQYHQMAEAGIFSPECRVELIDGEIFEMAPVGPWHSGVVNRLTHRFVTALGDRVVVHVQNPVGLDPRSEPQPDVMLLRPRADFYGAAHPNPAHALLLGWLGYMSVSGGEGATLAHYRHVFTDPQLQKALWNTVVLAFWVGLVSLAIGAPMAWLTARTDLPGRRLIRGLIMASFVTPPFLGAFAWVMLAGPNAGLLNKLYRALTGAEAPLVNVFSMPGLIFVVSIYPFPYVFIMIANTLELIASDLEDAASILGASRVRVALTVTLPMVLPAILSGFILAVLQALALFGSPAILALPAGFHTI